MRLGPVGWGCPQPPHLMACPWPPFSESHVLAARHAVPETDERAQRCDTNEHPPMSLRRQPFGQAVLHSIPCRSFTSPGTSPPERPREKALRGRRGPSWIRTTEVATCIACGSLRRSILANEARAIVSVQPHPRPLGLRAGPGAMNSSRVTRVIPVVGNARRPHFGFGRSTVALAGKATMPAVNLKRQSHYRVNIAWHSCATRGSREVLRLSGKAEHRKFHLEESQVGFVFWHRTSPGCLGQPYRS